MRRVVAGCAQGACQQHIAKAGDQQWESWKKVEDEMLGIGVEVLVSWRGVVERFVGGWVEEHIGNPLF